MLKWLLSNSKKKQQFLFHIGLGWVSLITPFVFIVWYYFIFLVFLQKISKRESSNSVVDTLTFLMYSASFEILGRIVNSSPYIPYEIGKYMTFFLVLVGLFKSKKIGTIGIVIFLLLVPGILIGIPYYSSYKDIVFNVLGTVNIALGFSLFAFSEISEDKLMSMLRLFTLPLVSILAYSIIRSPDIGDANFELGANTLVGGFGSNQIATIFGIALFMLYLMYNRNILFSGFSRWLDVFMIILFLFFGLLTFSRGGILVGFLGILFLIYFQTISSKKRINYFYTIFVLIFMGFAINIANNLTDGNLLLRYSGETTGTLLGTKEKDLNQLTSGRFNIFVEDIDLFRENILFGVGVKQSVFKRKDTEGTITHVEFGRLLSEHGIFGLLICLIFIFLLVLGFINGHKSFFNRITFILYFIGFFTTFHAATRTFVTPLFMPLIGLSQLKISKRVNQVAKKL
jgi:hypothetical protein